MQLNRKVPAWWTLFALAAFSGSAQAAKFELQGGGYIVDASTGSKSASVSGPGALAFGYAHRLVRHVEVTFGYTLLIAGDIANGFDIGARWFPVTENEKTSWESGQATLVSAEVWRPYVGVGFSQRQFQSVKAGYSGFGADIGIERTLEESFVLRAAIRYRQYAGQSGSSASEWNGLFGVAFNF